MILYTTANIAADGLTEFQPTGSQNVLSSDFFNLSFSTTQYVEEIFFVTPFENINSALEYFGTNPLSSVVELLDYLGKAISSFLLTDLSQSNPSNVFAQPSLLMKFVNQTESKLPPPNNGVQNMWEHLDCPPMNNETAFFNFVGFGIPSVAPATIPAQYLCQVPERKSTGSLIISVLVADLVFLQALWKILNWAVTLGLERRHPDARYCIGCAKQLARKGGYQLVDKAMSMSRRLSRESGSQNDVETLDDQNTTNAVVQVTSSQVHDGMVVPRISAETAEAVAVLQPLAAPE